MQISKLTPVEIRLELRRKIARLPVLVEQDDPQGGLLRTWVRPLPLRMQGVLSTAIRGCDGAPKEDASKNLSRIIRRTLLNPADYRESQFVGGFFGFAPALLESSLLDEFFHSLDEYPLHYIMHLIHTCEVIGYMHPDQAIADFFEFVYYLFCHTLHLNPESEEQMRERLTEDRIEQGITERNF